MGKSIIGGDWAGQQSIYAGAGCPGTCVGELLTFSIQTLIHQCSTKFLPVDYVNNNPSAFSNAYWNFAALRVYQ